MARVTKRAGDIKVGDQVFFPGSRRAQPVGQVLVEEGIVYLMTDDQTIKWGMPTDHEVAVSEEDPPS